MSLFENIFDFLTKLSILYVFYNAIESINIYNVAEICYYKGIDFFDETAYFFSNLNKEFYPFINDLLSDEESNEESNEETSENDLSIANKEVKYEEKYLKEVRNMSKDYNFDDVEQEMVNMTMREFYRAIVDSYVNEINILKDENTMLSQEISELEGYDSTDSKSSDGIIDTKKQDLFERIKLNSEKMNELESKMENKSKLESDALNQAKEEIYKLRLDKLVNSILIEKTPLGNVLMFYNNKKEVFEYFSDNTIPYRYLETVSRKYVKIFNCRRIYYDMEEELKLYELKLKQEMEKEKAENDKLVQNASDKAGGTQNTSDNKKGKNVFAKFKGYNKEAGTGHVSMAPPPKNSIPNNSSTKKSNEPILLKEHSNRYTYEGKLSNFSITKKIPLKAVDKKYAMTFSDFKKLQNKK